MNDNNQRRSIWDMNILDTTLYLVLFIVLMMPGMVYNIWYRLFYQQAAIPDQISLLTKDIGQVGFSAGCARVCHNRDKEGHHGAHRLAEQGEVPRRGPRRGSHRGLAVGRVEGSSETQQAWVRWNERRIEAERRGERFDEPPPGL